MHNMNDSTQRQRFLKPLKKIALIILNSYLFINIRSLHVDITRTRENKNLGGTEKSLNGVTKKRKEES